VLERIAALRELVGGFLVTFVEREGRLQGTDLAFAKEIRAAAGEAAVTIAGGITTAEEVRELDRLGCDAQIGMALYTDKLPLAEGFAAPLRSDRPDGLWPTIVADERGTALGLCYSNLDSLRAALAQGQGVYHSRARGLWVKGASSGASARTTVSAPSPAASPNAARPRRRAPTRRSCSPSPRCSAPSFARKRPSSPRPRRAIT
jgi:phosphoribosyl-AMP cyclohydrolase